MGKREELMEFLLLRHKDEIEEREDRSLSRLRQIISPYSAYVSKIKNEIIAPLAPYIKEEQFLRAADKIISHCTRIEVIELPIDYSLTFEEMESLGAGSFLDKCLLLTSLLRAAGSENAAVVSGKEYPLVKFQLNGNSFAINAKENKLIKGKDAEKFILNSKAQYTFNDLFFEVSENE
jgi:hypothetical protein